MTSVYDIMMELMGSDTSASGTTDVHISELNDIIFLNQIFYLFSVEKFLR